MKILRVLKINELQLLRELGIWEISFPSVLKEVRIWEIPLTT